MTTRIINNHIVVPTESPNQLKAIFPDIKVATIKDKTFCAVPFTLDAARVLNNLGIRTESPIRSQYEWPGRYTPRWYQADTAEFFTLNPRSHCHSAPRVGKTLSALWAADYLRLTKKIKRTLIVAPLSTLWDVWEQNIFESFPFRTFVVLHGSRQRRLDLLAKQYDFYIINHHGVALIEDALKSRKDIDHVIIDEVATFRNSRAKTLHKPLERVLNKQGISRSCWGLTGTPTPNDPTDAFGQCKLITPENYHSSFTAFKRETMVQLAQFKWVPKKGSEQSVARVLKPSIRFERSVCTDMEPCYIERRAQLSPDQSTAYKQLIRQAATEINGSVITAVNAAVLVSKLVQVACISADTMVVCARGLVPIQDVIADDLVWDGIEWVQHSGVQFNGVKTTVECFGVRMTLDHEVLTTTGWKTAKEVLHGNASRRVNREGVWAPYSIKEARINEGNHEVRRMAVPVRLWEQSNTEQPISSEKEQAESKTLRMQELATKQGTRNDEHASVQCVVKDAPTMHKPIGQRLEKLWGPWNNCLRSMERVIHEFLGGCTRWIQKGADHRQSGRKRPLRPRKFSMGYGKGTSKKQEKIYPDTDTSRVDAISRSSRKIRTEVWDAPGQNNQIQVAGRESTDTPRVTTQVFDITNCGPRSRYTVVDSSGELLIVHNCGVAYAADGSMVKFDFGPRLKVLEELIEENNEKVLVFVPFTGALDALAVELRKKWSVAIVDGGVSPAKRNQIFKDFRGLKDPHILLCHPQVMAHGLDLTTASLSIWYAPFWKAEIYQQANARTDGSKQTVKIDIAHIFATAEEKRIYSVLKDKGRLQDVVLALSKGGG